MGLFVVFLTTVTILAVILHVMYPTNSADCCHLNTEACCNNLLQIQGDRR